MSREEIVERLAIVSYICARSASARQGTYAAEWEKASNGMQDAHRNIAGRYLPEIERLLAEERERVREMYIAKVSRRIEIAQGGGLPGDIQDAGLLALVRQDLEQLDLATPEKKNE